MFASLSKFDYPYVVIIIIMIMIHGFCQELLLRVLTPASSGCAGFHLQAAGNDFRTSEKQENIDHSITQSR